MSPKPSDARGRPASPRRVDPASPDRRLEQTISRRLRAITVIRSDDVSVSSDRGQVVLRGSVESFSERLMCAEIAAAVAGQGAVSNELHVRTYDAGWKLGPGATPTSDQPERS